MSDNETIFNKYKAAVELFKTDKTSIETLKTAADALSDILTDDTENQNIKEYIDTSKKFDTNTTEQDINKLITSINNEQNLVYKEKVIVDENTNVDNKTPNVIELKAPLTDYKDFETKKKFKVITDKGTYIVFKGTTDEFSTLIGGKKSRKSKTHKQKKVHRSTQKRNGRKKTSHRRK